MSYEYVLEGSNVIFKELKGGDIMKMRTKGINILTILVYTMISLFTMSQPVQAATSEIITYEEYSDTIAKKYLEYGIETEMEPVSSGYVYTRELLNNELESIPVKVKYLKEWENKPVEIEGNSEDEKNLELYHMLCILTKHVQQIRLLLMDYLLVQLRLKQH